MLKAFIVSSALLAAVASANAQGWRHDRDYDRDYDRDARDVPGKILRSLAPHRDCRMVVERHRNHDGDIVVRRYRDCD